MLFVRRSCERHDPCLHGKAKHDSPSIHAQLPRDETIVGSRNTGTFAVGRESRYIFRWDYLIKCLDLRSTVNVPVLRDPRWVSIARKLGVDTRRIVFRFAMQAGIVPLTGTTDEQHMKDDIEVSKFELTAQESHISSLLRLNGFASPARQLSLLKNRSARPPQFRGVKSRIAAVDPAAAVPGGRPYQVVWVVPMLARPATGDSSGTTR